MKHAGNALKYLSLLFISLHSHIRLQWLKTVM